MVTLDIIKTSF